MIPYIPGSGNYLVDMYDDELSDEELQESEERKYDQAEDACDDR